MRPFLRMCQIAVLGYFGYIIVTPSKSVERMPPYPQWAEQRRQKGLSDAQPKHPFFGLIKEVRIVPPEEERPLRR